ncbi:hypothetical protein [Parasitella parasitica]|uniref:NAD(P)-binding domain-containing protein n=1 Tax=Parasitella parasitica TaxID=35722 RepID=A0A0B7N782_9FUNG|nr:hypothetical protein [Parasitella parasitica]
MSSSDAATTKKIKYILITHGDSYLGQAIAMHIADQLDKGRGQLKTKHRAQVDYESQHAIREQIKVHIKTMIFNPFVATFGRMVECGKHVLDVAIREDVKRIVMISSYGVDALESSSEESPMAQFSMLESYMRHQHKYGSWVVYRIPFLQQYMYFWRLMFENKNAFGMPISQGDMLTSVNVKDVLDCVAIASLSKKSMVWTYREPHRHLQASTILPGGPDGGTSSSSDDSSQQTRAIKRVYELTSQPLSLATMAYAMSRALRKAGSGFDVDAAVISDEQLESYLKLVAKSAKNRTSSANNEEIQRIFDTITRFTDEPQQTVLKDREHQDSPDLYPCPADTLTPFCIHLIMSHFKVARNTMPPMVPNNDIRDITGRMPIQMDAFFMTNRRLFRPE